MSKSIRGLGLEANGGSPKQIVELFRDAGYKLYIQDDVHYRFPFRPLDTIPNRWFQLVATGKSAVTLVWQGPTAKIVPEERHAMNSRGGET